MEVAGGDRAGLLAALGALGLLLLLLVFWPAILASQLGGGTSLISGAGLPAGAQPFLAVYADAGRVFGVSPFVLMAIHEHETGFSTSRLPGVSSGVNFAGCCAGPMQFAIASPAGGGQGGTWAVYRWAVRRARVPRPARYPGQTAAHPDVYDSIDAIYAAAAYLHALGADRQLGQATFTALVHYGGVPPASIPYARDILARAQEFERIAAASADVGGASARGLGTGLVRIGRVTPWLGPVPGEPWIRCDRRILPDLGWLMRVFDLRVNACYALTGHATNGEHPLGLAADLQPRAASGYGCNASWRKVTALAHLVEPVQNQPRPPFRWVGYDGDPDHGCGNHLHLSWLHAPAAPGTEAAWVEVFR